MQAKKQADKLQALKQATKLAKYLLSKKPGIKRAIGKNKTNVNV